MIQHLILLNKHDSIRVSLYNTYILSFLHYVMIYKYDIELEC